MKFILEKIFHGFLLAIGFGVVLGGVYYYMTQFMIESMNEYSFKTETIKITKQRKIERDNKLLILGELKNTGEQQAKGVNVNVDLYLKNEFVKQCNKHISGGVSKGETRNFEITCGGGCKKNPIVEHDSYKIYITGL